jgi:hypothetical protein
MEIYITPIIFLILASIMKVISDTIKFHWYSSIFGKLSINSRLYKWLNPDIAWMNMYKEGYKPLGEKFWGSSRWFAFISDGWHLFDLLKTIFSISILTFFIYYIPFTSILIGVNILSRLVDTFILFTIFSLIFEYLFVFMEKKGPRK